ncbi:Deoxyribonuclease Tat-D [Metarhizium anisopliae]
MASQAGETPNGTYKPRYVDIGINLSDPIFRGRHHGHQKHPDDLTGVIDRARQVGCTKLIVTGSDIKSSQDALNLAEEYQEHHPDAARSAHAISLLTTVVAQARSSGQPHMVAMGEFGLDYDRLNYCNRVIQKHSFEAQLRVAASLQPQLPLFLHSRAAHGDFVAILKGVFGERLESLEKGGVVHSFTGTMEEMEELMDLGLYIGINGCSFKTEENCRVVKAVRLDRLMMETDGPWCEVRPSHEGYKYLIERKAAQAPVENGTAAPQAAAPEPQAKQPKKQKNQKKQPEVPDRFKIVKKEKWEEGAMIKGRNEPCTIERVAQIIAAIKDVSVEESRHPHPSSILAFARRPRSQLQLIAVFLQRHAGLES